MKDQLFVEARVKDGELHFPIKAFEIKFKNFLKEQSEFRSKLNGAAKQSKPKYVALFQIYT